MDAERPSRSLVRSSLVLLLLLIVLVGAFLYGKSSAHRGATTAFDNRTKKERLVAEMQENLLSSVEAEKSAVMAESDEVSQQLADEVRRASAAFEKDRLELGRLIEGGERPDESALFLDLNVAWTTLQELDRVILAWDEENTNLKALRLSFSPADEPLARMEAALNQLPEESTAATDAMIAALKIHVLESRHIAEAREEEMDRIEAEMKRLDSQARDGLTRLATESGEPPPAAVEEARSAYDDFQKVNAQILQLSRRNSNVASLTRSLGEKRKATASCLALLNALQEAIQSERLSASR